MGFECVDYTSWIESLLSGVAALVAVATVAFPAEVIESNSNWTLIYVPADQSDLYADQSDLYAFLFFSFLTSYMPSTMLITLQITVIPSS